MIEISTEESRYKNALIIADKGFYSQENLEILEKHGHKYIIPLKRSSALIESNRYRNLPQSVNHFLFEDRVIYYDSYTSQEGRMIYLFVDEAMMVKEKKDFICRMEKYPNRYTQEKFVKQLPFFGSLALMTNKEDEPRSVYVNYKNRAGIEILFDESKNILGNDFTYMQNDQALEGWMFINHLALLVHHKIYALLKEKKMIKKYSIRDFIEFLADVKKVRINQEWVLEPMIKEQKKLLNELGMTIP
jgi:transposase